MPKKYRKVRELDIDGAVFTVWCDGRDYDPELEVYRPVYSYSIVTNKWRYDANDLRGAPNEIPNLDLASTALLALLLTCSTASDDDENSELFPPHVREYGQEISQTLKMVCAAITGNPKE